MLGHSTRGQLRGHFLPAAGRDAAGARVLKESPERESSRPFTARRGHGKPGSSRAPKPHVVSHLRRGEVEQSELGTQVTKS